MKIQRISDDKSFDIYGFYVELLGEDDDDFSYRKERNWFLIYDQGWRWVESEDYVPCD